MSADHRHAPPPSPLDIHARLRIGLTEAVIAQAEIRHPALNAFLRAGLAGSDLARGALLASPVFEGAAPYASSGCSLDSLGLNSRLVSSLVGRPGDQYRFDYQPYAHQIEAWTHLRQPDARSVLVSSGTGSGKTECFLVPMLEDLAREVAVRAAGDRRLTGVRALMLYPLNALIASQEHRLRRWTAPFGGDIRFALFNGLMLDKRKSARDAEEAATPEQVRYRTTLRSDPPPILVTNSTMLEYMTIRREDQSILERSKGMLRWIVIDEAHNYVGSAAAEISLLLRRVLQSFGVEAGQVRFVATSATIGRDDAEGRASLQQFLADLAGVPTAQVHVVMGRRDTVDISGDAIKLRPAIQPLIAALQATPLDLVAIERQLAGSGLPADEALNLVAGRAPDSPVLLPLRAHNFVRAVAGLWSCLNTNCRGERPSDWPFGSIHWTRLDKCGLCNAPVLEIVSCRECGEPWLQAFDHGDRLEPCAVASDRDDFVSAKAREEEFEGELDDSDPPDGVAAPLDGLPILISTRSIPGLTAMSIDPANGAILERRGDHQVWVTKHSGECPHCHVSATPSRRSPLLPFRFGAPFLLQNAAPTMLEGVSPNETLGAALPSEGRQLLSFTDSRQGTARFAANIETQAERGFLRGFLFQAVQKPSPDKSIQSDEVLQQKLAKLRSLDNDLFADQISEIEAQLTRSAAPKTVPWLGAVDALASEPEIKTMAKVWDADRDPRYANNPQALANMLMLRELARRPRRANSAETLGLVRLVAPPIEAIAASRVPGKLTAANYGIAEWRDFLYFLLDSVVRQNFALQIDPADARWFLPRKLFLRQIAGPGREKLNASDHSWPRARAGGTKTNAQRALEAALHLDGDDPVDRLEIDEILSMAFDQVKPLLEGIGSTLALRFDKLELARIEGAWLCPVTRRVLPRLLFGHTPYGVRTRTPDSASPPTPIRFPNLPSTFPRNSLARQELASFVNTDPAIAELRKLGVWGNLQDRAATFAPFIRAEEHSAQQPPHRLREFEAEFQRGEINLLACSTTMEMGVDIGSVEAVLNTNVPPSIANYRQRIGRAGRRGQSYASSLTFARDMPLDREAFSEPVAYLKRELRAPTVQLDSDRIVQRHVNALLLATWMQNADGELARIRAGDFFGFAQEDGLHMPDPPPVARFLEWLDAPSTVAQLGPRVLKLAEGSRLRDPAAAIGDAQDKFRSALDGFGRAWEALHRQMAGLAPDARRSIALQIKRMCREPLLSELGNRSVLPSHGFPTGVMPFVTDCAVNRLKPSSDDRSEASRNRRYDYPSRAGPIAIREYAPGAEVVIDGLVWTSAGVTLNWQRPAHEEGVREIQSIRCSWSCRDCGEIDCGPTAVEACLACGSVELERQRFLEPAGFRVDWNDKPHADTNVPIYIAPEAPQVSARGARWEPLLDPALGRARATGDGLVFNYSRGAAQAGYRICLDCGRAAEEAAGALADHDALMPQKGAAGHCSGNSKQYAITDPLSLGYETLTDVAEIQPVAIGDPAIALAMASAFREALARTLGIETRELGISVAKRQNLLGGPTHSIYLYDLSAGGAGYSPRIFDDIRSVLKAALEQLFCPADCASACSACVLAADLYAEADRFDRRGAADALSDMIAAIAAPSAADLAGDSSEISPPIGDAIVRGLNADDVVTVFLPAEFDLGALSDPPLSTTIAMANARGARTTLVLSAAAFGALDDAARSGFRDASHRLGFTIATGEAPVGRNGATLIAVVASPAKVSAFFSRDAGAAVPGPSWGVGGECAIVRARLDTSPATTPVPPDALERSVREGSRVRFLERDPARPLAQFGQLLVANVLKPELDAIGLWKFGALVGMAYSDRYIKAPLPTALALRTMAALRDALVGKARAIPITITAMRGRDDRYGQYPRSLHQNWTDDGQRVDTTVALASLLDLECQYQTGSAPHGRELTLTYADGTSARILFDQGFGYWRTQSDVPHNFRSSPATQAKSLLDARAAVHGQMSSYIAVTAG